MPEFYTIIARKIFFHNFFMGGGGHVPLLSVSYAYGFRPSDPSFAPSEFLATPLPTINSRLHGKNNGTVRCIFEESN